MDLPFKGFKSTNNALWVEHNVQRIITRQEEVGVQFDQKRGRRYIRYLTLKREELYNKIRPSLSLELTTPYSVPVSKPFLKQGGYCDSAKKWYADEELQNVSGPFTRIEYSEPDLGKRGKLVAQFLSLGWRPTSFTKKGSPRLVVEGEPCPNLEKIEGDLGQWIAKWYIYNHRAGQITGWQNLVRDDGRIEARAITIGTPTYRFRHSGLVNVPKVSKLFGKQMRRLFTVKNKDYRFVGFDASGLELRMLADATKDKDFIWEILNGEIHVKNQRDAGLPDRDSAKTFIYAFNYGAGDAKIGQIIGGSRVAGKRIKSKFLASNPKLAETIKNTQRAGARGYLIGLDGRKVNLRRDLVTKEVQTHKALNTRLQSAGALVMKYAMVILDEWITEMGLDAEKIIDMHDEGQFEVHKDSAQLVGVLGCASIVKAGELLGLCIPLAGEYKVGMNWSETH